MEVGLMLYRDCQAAMVHGITDLFAIASIFSRDRGGPAVRVSHWRMDAEGRFSRSHDTDPGAPGTPDILVVPGRLTGPAEAEEAAPYARWLLDRHGQGATLASTCGGTFILAATGLLTGRPATTHWLFAERFRERFPDVRLEADKIVIEDGDIITAGGLMAWTDLGLRIVDRLLGPSVTIETGKFLLVDPSGREQRHYSNFAPRLTHGDEAVLKVQHWLQERGGRPTSIADMAGHARLEERTFLRRFKTATGMKPIEYVQHLRIGKARELLEFTRRTVDQIAFAVGYEDAAAFRRVFHRILGLSPGEYRSRFSVAVAA
ncbi:MULTISPECIES: GlxA family transcriptional regulator [unclassified Shinella]|jgi:transcriptional regulator GlxA family with amidase domain|uniref:GlxA family transcriptional regulator n=2 Tax=Shinella TaxID=323620 RepID=UPI0003C54D0D|nr:MULTISPECIES: GlxA family transcriptional regulator [unclassified Shinella]EYR83925.1 transcriptional regulator, AraC family [Shinella sp. DD12]MCO5151757.1 GlxA family transcriptional regulator [Shinella sp.]MDC7266486.1 GlxA family transcriptional regulator [Shinella sp. HY16]MDC7273383.1 GlxA family transcriptional regulator [Shinella sp. YZ44]MDG4675036.1 GlxA family transcriptional regulator [Shinella sp. 838]